MTEVALPSSMQEAIDTQDWDRLEELWLEALDRRPIPTPMLLEVRRLMWKAGRKTQATTLLELLAETLESNENSAGALAALRELIRLTGSKDPEMTERLLAAFQDARKASPSLTEVMLHYKPEEARHPLDVVEEMEMWLNHDVGSVVEVQGQGVGRVTEINLELGNLKVDVGGRRPISIPLGAVERYVRVLPEGSFLRHKVEDPEALSNTLTDDPGAALVHLLEDFDEPADVAQIKGALEGLLDTTSWTSWWGKARKHPRILSSGSGSRLRYEVTGSAADAADALIRDLRSAGPRDRLKAAKDLAGRGADEAGRAADLLTQGLDELLKVDPGLAWETADLLATLPGGADAAEQTRRQIIASAPPLKLLSGIKERSSRQGALEAIREGRPDEWPAVWAEWLLREKSASALDSIARRLDDEGHQEILDTALETIFRNHLKHPAQFVWAAESVTEDDAPSVLQRRLTPSLLEKIPDLLSRKEFAHFRSRGKGLLEGGKAAIRIVLEQASSQQATRFTGRLGRIDSIEPVQLRRIEQAARQAGTSTDAEVEVVLFAATEAAIDAKRAELRDLLEIQIPKTLKGINAAAAEGDLRENFEYHMLRDRQELQSAQAAKLQEDLARVRVLEPGAADASKVNIGTVIEFETTSGSPIEPLTILGAWDADLDRRIFANGTELAESLLGRSVGDPVAIDGSEGRIAAIEAWKG